MTKNEEWLNGYLVNAYGDGMAGDVWERGIDWVIVGGESGQDARPMQREWAESLRDQCVAASVPYFFKQWGEWGPILSTGDHSTLPYRDGMVRFGKKRSGRLLGGREWNETPISA